MFFYTLKTTLISLIIIISFHYFYNYLINTFTVKKNKNILNDTVYNYNQIIETLNKKSEKIEDNNSLKKNIEKNNIEKNNIEKNDTKDIMKKELKDYYNNIKDKNI